MNQTAKVAATKVTRKLQQMTTTTVALQRFFGTKLAMQSLMRNIPSFSDEKYYTNLRNELYARLFTKIPYASNPSSQALPNDGPVWIMWWQGLDSTTDPLILACISSIKRHAGNRPVHIVTHENYSSFVTLPSKISELLKSHVISFTYLSDYLRCALLYEHGGIWVDSSIYMTQDFDQEISEYNFYSASRDVTPQSSAFSERWSIYFLASTPRNPLYKYLLDCYLEYWSNVHGLVDYFLTDSIFKIAYTHIDDVQATIDRVPSNNLHCSTLQHRLNQDVDSIEPIHSTYIHKLTYKSPYRQKTANGKPTIYNLLINGNYKLVDKAVTPRT